MFGPLGVPELLFIFALALLVFGPRKLPEVGRALGRGMAELRKASNDLRRTINTELIDEEMRQSNPTRIVRDSLRGVKDDLDRAVRGEPAADAKSADSEPPPSVEGAVARQRPQAAAPEAATTAADAPSSETRDVDEDEDAAEERSG